MGEPFYKKYNFTFNLDAKMIGFYNPYFDFEKEEEINGNNNVEENNNNTWKIIIFCVLGFIILALLMFLSFYFGMKIKEGRKKRANELKMIIMNIFLQRQKKNRIYYLINNYIIYLV